MCACFVRTSSLTSKHYLCKSGGCRRRGGSGWGRWRTDRGRAAGMIRWSPEGGSRKNLVYVPQRPVSCGCGGSDVINQFRAISANNHASALKPRFPTRFFLFLYLCCCFYGPVSAGTELIFVRDDPPNKNQTRQTKKDSSNNTKTNQLTPTTTTPKPNEHKIQRSKQIKG